MGDHHLLYGIIQLYCIDRSDLVPLSCTKCAVMEILRYMHVGDDVSDHTVYSGADP